MYPLIAVHTQQSDCSIGRQPCANILRNYSVSEHIAQWVRGNTSSVCSSTALLELPADNFVLI
jgi:hypothetical protein